MTVKSYTIKTVFSAQDHITAVIERVNTGLGKIGRNAQMVGARLDRSSTKALRGLRDAGFTAAAGGYAFKRATDSVVDVGAEFEQAIVNAGVRFSKDIIRGTKPFNELRDAAREIGRTTQFTAVQAAQSLDFLARGGFGEGDYRLSTKAVSDLVDFAIAAGEPLEKATSIIMDSMGSLKLATGTVDEQYAKMRDLMGVMTVAANSSNLDIGNIFESLKKAGPIATSTGARMREVAALFTIMGKAGVKSEIAGTAVANFYQNLVSPTSGALKALRALGVNPIDKKTKELKSLVQIVGELGKALAGRSGPQKLGLLTDIFQKEGLAGMMTVIEAGSGVVQKYLDSFEGVEEVPRTLSKVMQDTTKVARLALTSAFESLFISTFDKTPGYRKFIEAMTKWVRMNETPISDSVSGFFSFLSDVDFNKLANDIVKVSKAIAGVAAVLLTAKVASFALLNPFTALAGAAAAIFFITDEDGKRFEKLCKIGTDFANIFPRLGDIMGKSWDTYENWFGGVMGIKPIVGGPSRSSGGMSYPRNRSVKDMVDNAGSGGSSDVFEFNPLSQKLELRIRPSDGIEADLDKSPLPPVDIRIDSTAPRLKPFELKPFDEKLRSRDLAR